MPGGHILDRFAEAVVANKQAMLNQIDHAAFDATARLLADPGRRIYAVGGRITHAVADYFGALIRMVWPDVTVLSQNPATWATALIGLGPGDVVLVFDIRHY